MASFNSHSDLLGHAKPSYKQGRKCKKCKNLLSIYNSGNVCLHHKSSDIDEHNENSKVKWFFTTNHRKGHK